MEKNKYLGKVCKIKLINKEDYIEGIINIIGQEWTLIKFIPVDFQIDGYALVNNKKIKDITYSQEQKFKENVINAKGKILREYFPVNLNNSKALFDNLKEITSLIQVDSSKEDVTYIGKLMNNDSEKIFIKLMSPKAKWLSKKYFLFTDIWVVYLDNDYLNSLYLYEKENLKKINNYLDN